MNELISTVLTQTPIDGQRKVLLPIDGQVYIPDGDQVVDLIESGI